MENFANILFVQQEIFLWFGIQNKKTFIQILIDWLFIVLHPAQEYFTDMETSP
jgi:hypothetical protein